MFLATAPAQRMTELSKGKISVLGDVAGFQKDPHIILTDSAGLAQIKKDHQAAQTFSNTKDAFRQMYTASAITAINDLPTLKKLYDLARQYSDKDVIDWVLVRLNAFVDASHAAHVYRIVSVNKNTQALRAIAEETKEAMTGLQAASVQPSASGLFGTYVTAGHAGVVTSRSQSIHYSEDYDSECNAHEEDRYYDDDDRYSYYSEDRRQTSGGKCVIA